MRKPPKKLLDQVKEKLRLKHYSIRTEDAYVSWIRRFILYHNKKHPKDMDEREVEAFLSHLAIDLKVASSTQNQALNALLFLYRYVLGKDLKAINAVRAKKPKKMPTVMTRSEISKVLKGMSGVHKLMAMIIYGSGLRLMECIRLRVEAKVPVPGAVRGERPDPIQIDDVLPMAAHEGRGRELFSQFMQPLHGTVGFFALGSD